MLAKRTGTTDNQSGQSEDVFDYLGIHQSFDYTDFLGTAGCVAHHFVLFMYTSGSTPSAVFFQSSVHSYFILLDVQLIFFPIA